jgi:hypothetical protein
MRLAHILPFHAEPVAQADIQAVGHDNETRGHLFAVRERDLLALRAGRDIHDLAVDEAHGRRDFAADGIDQRVVENAVLVARTFLDQAAEARHPGFPIERRCAQHRIGKAGLAQHARLRAVDLLAAEVGRVNAMRIDQHDTVARAPEHGRGGGAGKSAARDEDVGLAHGASSKLPCMRPKA